MNSVNGVSVMFDLVILRCWEFRLNKAQPWPGAASPLEGQTSKSGMIGGILFKCCVELLMDAGAAEKMGIHLNG